MSALTYLFCAPPAEEPSAEQSALPATFSAGLAPASNLGRRQRIAEARRKKILQKARRQRSLMRSVPHIQGALCLSLQKTYDFKFAPAKRWLLTDRGMPFAVSMFLSNAGKTFTEIYKTIMKKKRRQQNYFLRYNCYTTNEPAISLLNIYMKAAVKNHRLVRSFRCLARRWMLSKLTAKNTEDLVTGEPPICPVRLIDWRTRSVYVFEARTIARDIVSRLTMSHYDFFPWPQAPRNPYTNESLTEGQFYSVAQQLRTAGQTHWSIEALYSTKHNVAEFERDMYSKLKRTIHNSVFANPCGDVAKRILLEYIEEEHDMHKMLYEADIYTWAIENAAHHFSMHKWRIECAKYYTIVHFPGEKQRDDNEKDKIYTATRELCRYPAALVERYNAVHEKKYVNLEERAADRAAREASIIDYPFVFGVIDISAFVAASAAEADASSDDSASEAE